MSHYNLPINLSTVCETTLVLIHNDILVAIDERCCVMLLLSDLSAAFFDTVDHDILHTRLHSKYSISGIALEWFHSYLTIRSQSYQTLPIVMAAFCKDNSAFVPNLLLCVQILRPTFIGL